MAASIKWQRTNPRTNAVIENGLLVFDVLLEETVSKDATATKFPIEVGAQPADHHRAENAKISLQAYILGYGLTTAQGGVRTTAEVESQDGDTDIKALEILDGLRKDSVLLTYATPRTNYDNLLITSLRFTNTVDTGHHAVRLQLELEQQTFVELKRVKTKRIPKNAKNNVCAPTVNAGEKAPVQSVEKQKADVDLLSQILGRIY